MTPLSDGPELHILIFSMAGIFHNVPLMRNGSGPVDSLEALKVGYFGIYCSTTGLKDKVVLVYFSASWCPPCRKFSPCIKDFYETVIGEGGELEIVFVSSDRSEESQQEFLAADHAAWLYVPFNSEALENIPEVLNVSGIPAVVLLSENSVSSIPKEDFSVLTFHLFLQRGRFSGRSR